MVSAYSIGQAKRTSPQKNDVPAPNQYTLIQTNKLQSPKWTIGGVSKRQNRIKSQTPGPGTYPSKSSMVNVPCCTIKGRLKDRVISQSPGPGNYNEDSFSTVNKRVPSYSMGVKIEKIIKSYVPGPGTYDMTQTHFSTITSKFPIEKRLKTEEGNTSPGPGQYKLTNIDRFSPHKSQPSWGFGSKNNQKMHQSLDLSFPGPGNYELKSTLTQQSFTLKPKLKTQEGDKSIPGPGKYSPNISIVKSAQPVFKIGREQRAPQVRVTADPGPGKYYQENYDTKSRKSQPCYSQGKAQRMPPQENNSILVPGPGQYDVLPPKLGNITLKGVRSQSKPKQIPGPGSYNPEDKLCYQNDGSVKIAPDINQNKKNLTESLPGPGTYDFKRILMGPQWGFGKPTKNRQIFNVKSDNPGPGAYDVPSKFADVPKYLNCKPKFQV